MLFVCAGTLLADGPMLCSSAEKASRKVGGPRVVHKNDRLLRHSNGIGRRLYCFNDLCRGRCREVHIFGTALNQETPRQFDPPRPHASAVSFGLQVHAQGARYFDCLVNTYYSCSRLWQNSPGREIFVSPWAWGAPGELEPVRQCRGGKGRHSHCGRTSQHRTLDRLPSE